MANKNTTTIIIILVAVAIIFFRTGLFSVAPLAVVPSTFNPATGVCEYTPPPQILACNDINANFNSVTGNCEITPGEIILPCTNGVFNSVSGVCEVQPSETLICSQGTLVGNVCEIPAPTDLTCPDTSWTLANNICTKQAPIQFTCPDPTHVLIDTDSDGIGDTCEFTPPVTPTGCASGQTFDNATQTCQFAPQVVVSNCKSGATPTTNANGNPVCITNPTTKIECTNPLHTAVDTNGDGVVDECQFTPPVKGVCTQGEFNPLLNICNYALNTTIVCNKDATFNPLTNQCELSGVTVTPSAPAPTPTPNPLKDPITLGIIGATVTAIFLSRRK